VPLELPDVTLEGVTDALQYQGLTEADASNPQHIAAEITRHVVHWAAHWREVLRR
jgi:hypothetical protein